MWEVRLYLTRDALMPLPKNQLLCGSSTFSECPQILGFTPLLWIYYHHYL